jgi:hypothetical protein
MDENKPTSSVREGERVRRITMKEADSPVSHRHKRDVAEPHIRSSIDITNAGGRKIMMKKARKKKGSTNTKGTRMDRKHDKYHTQVKPPTQQKEEPINVMASTTRKPDRESGQTGAKAKARWSRQKAPNQRYNTINTSTSVSPPRTSTEEVPGYADPEAGRSKKRPRGQLLVKILY